MPKVHKFARENKNKKRIDPKVDIFLICFSKSLVVTTCDFFVCT